MRLNHIDLNLFVALDALLAERSITRAGQKLNLSQSGTSGALGRLREHFKDDLLVQVGRQMVLTPLGEMLSQPVRDILLQVQATVDMSPVFDAKTCSRKITLIMSDYTTTVLMPDVIKLANDIAPGVFFEILPPVDNAEEELMRGNVDFLLLPNSLLSKLYPSTTLFNEDFVCVCASDNKLVGDNITQEQYVELGHVIVRFGTQRSLSFDESLIKGIGIDRRAEVVVPTFDIVPRCLIGTNRIATIHRRLANLWCTHLPLRTVPMPFDIPVVEWGLQWHQYRDNDPTTIWIRDLIFRTAKSHNVLQHTETASLLETLRAQRNLLSDQPSI